MLDTPRTWRYQSAVLLGPRPKLPDQLRLTEGAGRRKGGVPPLSAVLDRCYGAPAAENNDLSSLVTSPGNLKLALSRQQSLMQATQQVSLLTPRPIPGTAGSVRAFAGVAQLVEHLFCKQVVSGSIPLASSSSSNAADTEISEGCPSGQREQAVNLPAHAYVGSNPTPSTIVNAAHSARGPQPGMLSPRRGLLLPRNSAGVTQLVESQFSKLKVDGSSIRRRGSAPPQAVLGAPPQVLGPRPQNSRRGEATNFAGVTQLVESQFSKLKVDGSSPFSRSNFLFASRLSLPRTQQQTRPASLVAGEALASTGAERTPVREHRSAAKAQPPAKIAGRRYSRNDATPISTNTAHLAQLVEHVLGKDEVISSNLMVGSNLQP